MSMNIMFLDQTGDNRVDSILAWKIFRQQIFSILAFSMFRAPLWGYLPKKFAQTKTEGREAAIF